MCQILPEYILVAEILGHVTAFAFSVVLFIALKSLISSSYSSSFFYFDLLTNRDEL